MTREQMIRNMSMILSGEEMSRIEVNETEDGAACVDLDLHQLTRSQAERLLKNVINLIRGEFVLNAIHGFNHGVVLKKMVMETSFGRRVIDRRSPAWNPGQTFLKVAA